MPSQPNDASSPFNRCRELAAIFVKLGLLGFGGPAAHIGMMNDEAVTRRQWLTAEEFAEGLAVCEILPGPASTQLCIYTGYIRAGFLGAIAAGLSFITPAWTIVVLLSWGYYRYQGVPQVDALFLGISPVVTAIVANFALKLGRKSIRQWQGAAISIAVFTVTIFTSVNILVQFLVAGAIGLYVFRPAQSNLAEVKNDRLQGWVMPLLPTLDAVLLPFASTSEAIVASGLWGVDRITEFFWPLVVLFLQTGSFIFGGGLVIIPLLEFEIVDRLGWMTTAEFIHGVAIGQLSPGPVVLTSAFVGYKVSGILGALVAATAVFLPSFAFILLAAPLLVQVRQNRWVRAFLTGVTPAVLGAIAAAAIPIARAAFLQETLLLTAIAISIGLAALLGLVRFKIPTWQLVPAGAIVGLATHFAIAV